MVYYLSAIAGSPIRIPLSSSTTSLPLHRDGCPRSPGNQLAVLVGNRHLGDAHPLAAFHHVALGGKLVIHAGAGNEMDVELRGIAWEGKRVGGIGE